MILCYSLLQLKYIAGRAINNNIINGRYDIRKYGNNGNNNTFKILQPWSVRKFNLNEYINTPKSS